jgi:gas vesicle protein
MWQFMNKYMRGFVVGSMIGVAAGMLLLPQMDGSTRKKVMRTGKGMVENASHIIPRMGRR